MTLRSAEARGSGKAQSELTAPQLVISSPAGMALTTPGSTHIRTGEHTVVTAEQHVAASVSGSFLVSALGRISLFAESLGMKLFAGAGKVAVQAQSGDLDIIAEKVASIISVSRNIRLSAAKEIIISAGGSYLRVGPNGIEKGTNGQWAVYAQAKRMFGPASRPSIDPVWTRADMDVGGQTKVQDELSRYVETERYAANESAAIDPDAAQHGLQLFHGQGGADGEARKLQWGETRRVLAAGSIATLGKDMAADADGE